MVQNTKWPSETQYGHLNGFLGSIYMTLIVKTLNFCVTFAFTQQQGENDVISQEIAWMLNSGL